MKQNFLFVIISICCISIVSCKKSTTTPAPTIVKQWSGVTLSTKFENPAPPGRTETGTAEIKLFSDSTVSYAITINNLLAGDALVAGHIHWGDAVTNGPVIVSFNPTFTTAGTASTASGTVSIRSTLADSLQTQPIYINFHSTNFPGGLVRAQLDKVIDFAADVSMTGASEVAPVVTTATGKAFIRLTTDKTLYSKVTISNLEPGDAMTAAHIHKAGSTTNGPVIQILCASAAEFGISMTHVLSDALITSLKTDSIYANAHSTAHPGGIVRAQIR